ncbi:MAG: glycoside hydrolase family 127 protein [Coriobacteriia bacterium]|nr:glycoside hydrolase family 127 protein [Coriobacteriia bacterium]
MKTKHVYRFIVVGILILLIAIPAFAKAKESNGTKRAVPFSEVEVNEGFMHDYMKLVICKVIPTAIENVEKDGGGIKNIKNCAKWHRGEIERPKQDGAIYVDSDVHKVLESMCMALDTPTGGDAEIEAAQATIKAKLEEWIPYYIDAPEKEDGTNRYKGYFDTYWSIYTNDQGEEYQKYSNVDNHELYCQGHFMEAAVAHYRYTSHEGTPDTRLLNVAINSADHIVKTFGTDQGQRKQIPGHQEIELALMKLAKLCQEIGGEYSVKAQGYINKAAYFLEERGNYEGRTADLTPDRRIYYQDHLPVANQTEAFGHAVRAQYMYTGMAELASIDPNYATKYDNALKALWDNVTHKKQYITGGIGDKSNSNEGFAGNYFLPNYTSYCETCAGVANMLWNRSMSTLYDGSKYADQIETDLYNNVLGCVNFEGNKFYYQNHICDKDAFDRSSWFGTACCPPNFTRTILQVGGYIYNTSDDEIFVNQYISNNAKFDVGGNKVNINMKSTFPYKSNGEITITPEKSGKFNVNLRKPSWADSYNIKVNGSKVDPQEKDGYLIINHDFGVNGTKIEFEFDMPLKYVNTDSNIETNEGLVALRHGPLLYCSEGCDNDPNFDYNKAIIDRGTNYNFEPVTPLDGMPDPYGVCSVSVLKHGGKLINGSGTSDITWKLIPYYARCNRQLGSMRVFMHDSNYPIKTHRRATASTSYTWPADTVQALNDGIYDKDIRWTSYKEGDYLRNPNVQYDFKEPVKFKGFRIWWYDDKGGVQLPDDISFVVYNKTTGVTEEVTSENFAISNDNKYTVYQFPKTYEGNQIRMTIKNEKSAHAAGIVQWELIDDDTLEGITVSKMPNKTQYVVGESFDPTGMVVEASYPNYANKAKKEITNYTYSPSKFEHAGDQEVTISYTEGETTKTTSIPVKVSEAQDQTNSDLPITGDHILLMLLIIALIAITIKLAFSSKKIHLSR